MASGKTHDTSILLTTPVVFAVAQHYTKLPMQEIFTLSGMYLFGGLYLSPDIDMARSVVSKRYGLLKIFWYPYQRIFPHKGKFLNRNFFTHFPVVGTVLRLIYFLIPCAIAFMYFKVKLLPYHWHYLGLFVLAVEIASLVHLFLDFIYTKRS
jgi:uncharacterized metal-binding protein